MTRESQLHRAICAALDAFDAPIEDLRFDDLVARLADALAAHDPAPQRISAKAESAVRIAREYLDEASDLPSSATLERLTGLSRFELARQFRKCLGTSPHRYATMRRLDRARRLILTGDAAAQRLRGPSQDRSHRLGVRRSALRMIARRLLTLTPSRGVARSPLTSPDAHIEPRQVSEQAYGRHRLVRRGLASWRAEGI